MSRTGQCPRHGFDAFKPVCTHVLTAVNDGRPLKIFLQVDNEDNGWETFGLCDACMRLRPGHDIGNYVCIDCLIEWGQATGNDVFERLKQLDRGLRPADELDE